MEVLDSVCRMSWLWAILKQTQSKEHVALSSTCFSRVTSKGAPSGQGELMVAEGLVQHAFVSKKEDKEEGLEQEANHQPIICDRSGANC